MRTNFVKAIAHTLPPGMRLEEIDSKEVKVQNGVYLSDDILAKGDMVLTVRGTGKLVDVFQRNYLPRFVIKDFLTGRVYTIGKTKIRGKFVTDG